MPDSSLRSRMTGRHLLSFCKKLFFRVCSHFFPSFVSAHTYKNLIAFFLSVSFPRTRREVPSLRGDRGKFVYTSKNHLTPATYA